MKLPLPGCPPLARLVFSAFALVIAFATSLVAQEPSPSAATPDAPPAYDADITALILARKYLAGGDDSRAALLEALGRMGWDVRNHPGVITHPAPPGTATGLAMRDYELDELLWKPSEQPAIRFISFAQAVAVPFEDADAEELAQDLVDTLRKSAESKNPQQRFWACFIIALGRVSQAGYDLSAPAPSTVIPPDPALLKALEKQGAAAMQNPFAMIAAMQPTPVWPDDDAVLAPSPRPKRDEDDARGSTAERDQKRMDELSDELGKLSSEFESPDPDRQKAAIEKMTKLNNEMASISQRMAAAGMQQMATAMKKVKKAQSGDFSGSDEDENNDDGPRFVAEFRDQPLSLLQVALLTRVLTADIRLHTKRASATTRSPTRVGSFFTPSPSRAPASGGPTSLPFAMITLAQAAPGPAPSFGDQLSGAAGDIWATSWGAYTGAVLDHHLPDNKFSKGAAIANTIMAWLKTIMTVARQKISITVDNEPLIRTKTRTAGQQRTARAKVEIDFPKSDVLKAIRAAGNLTTIDLQVPDGGPVSGAKVVWRLPEGSYNNKYQTAKGGWEYKPEFAVVQFTQGAGYVTTTNDAGETSITIEGVPQKKMLSSTVRPYPRRAAIAVEVTIKVGNITQDFNDAIGVATGGPVLGGLNFLADMVLRTSFLFQKSHVFEVTDWKEPAWAGEFMITAKASGSKTDKGEKGGPPTTYTWKMDRKMHGYLNTPDQNEDDEDKKNYNNDGRHKLEVNGDTRAFRLDDSSSAKSRKSHNRYEASGPIQLPPPGDSKLEFFGRSEPSGTAELIFNGGKMMLELKPFFGAECYVGTSEQSGGRSKSQAAVRFLSLLEGVYPDSFMIIEDNDGTQDYVEGTKTFDNLGSLPYVPRFDVSVTVTYRLWKNEPPPKNKKR